MNQISFPLLNLKLNIPKIAFKLFGLEIYWYAVIIVAAIITALLICRKKDGIFGIKFETVLDIAIILIPVSIISARLYYIIFNLSCYLENPEQILHIRSGGLAIYGGIIGGAITIWIMAKKKNVNVLDLLDYLVPALAIGQSIGRWGNFINMEAYGYETNLPWKMGIIEAGEYIEVHPTFLYESICTFILFLMLTKMQKKRKFKGQITAIYLISYGIIRAIIECIRVDSLMLR